MIPHVESKTQTYSWKKETDWLAKPEKRWRDSETGGVGQKAHNSICKISRDNIVHSIGSIVNNIVRNVYDDTW